MKKLTILLIFLLSSFKTYAITDKEWKTLISSIIHIESRGNKNAINKKGDCVGILQITPILVKDCNRIVGYKKYNLNDRYNVEKSIEMFNIIQEHYNKEKNLEKAIRLWNGGSNFSVKKTEKYFKKVLKEYNQRLK